jgi:CDP-4-dehydro-6-deoxyglucose reductase, E3
MSFRILVEPADHVIDAEPSETVLQAGLRSGLNLPHSCASGSCGQCRARLKDGTLHRIEPAGDYCFTDAEKAEGWFLMCRCRADGDVVVEAHTSGSAAEIPFQHVRARVSRLERLRDDVLQLTVRTPRSQGLQFLAGQSVALTLDGLAPRILPIASCPCDSVQLRFHVGQSADDDFAARVFAGLRRGDPVALHGPCGDFTLDETSTRPLVLVAWETGFASVSSLIDHAIQKDIDRSIDLYWLSAVPDGHYLANYCRAWLDVLDDFRYHAIQVAPSGDEPVEPVMKRIVRVHSLLADHDYYLALPAGEVDAARRFLAAACVPPAQCHLSVVDPAGAAPHGTGCEVADISR